MKFRTRMILAYATIALLVSLVLGLLMYRTGARYEQDTQKNNLTVSARSYVTQMDDRLDRMNAILYYILSDPSMLESITLLGRASDGNVPDRFLLNAKSTMQTGLSTEYIMQNSYRTVFYNQDGYFASSAVKQSGASALNQRLIESFMLEEISYLDPVIEADGRSVIVDAHPDFWGEYGNVPVYSLMKAPRGYRMGFLEVENRLDSLAQLETSDPGIRYLILVNGNDLLYDSEAAGKTESDSENTAMQILESAQEIRPDEILEKNGNVIAKAASEEYDLTVLAYKPAEEMTVGRERIFFVSFLAAVLTFGVSLIIIFFWSSILTRPVRTLQGIVESTNIENLKDQRRMEQINAISRFKEPDEFADLALAYQAMTERLNTAVENEKRSAMLQLQAQFDTLQTQVNPHFIYNVLNVISSRGVMADDEVICEMCGCLGSMLRYSTNNKVRYAKVREELEYLNSYFYLLKSRYEDRLQIHMDIDEGVKQRIIPKMTLQQIVENSIKHGYNETDIDMQLTLTGRETEDGWYMILRDNGTGITQERLSEIRGRLEEVRESFREMAVPTEAEIGGIGLTNTFARCLLLFGEDLIFELGNAPEGSGFEVKIGEERNRGDFNK